MKTIRCLLNLVAVDPSKLEGALKLIPVRLLDLNLESELPLNEELIVNTIHHLADLMWVSVTDNQVDLILTLLKNRFPAPAKITSNTLEDLINEVLTNSI